MTKSDTPPGNACLTGRLPFEASDAGGPRAGNTLTQQQHPTPSIRLFCSDLDGTLLGDPGAALRFKAAWQSLMLKQRPFLVYNSGREVEDMRRIVASGQLPYPDYYIGSGGTEIFDDESGRLLKDYHQHMERGWNIERVHRAVTSIKGIHLHPSRFQHAYRSCWFVDHPEQDITARLEERLAEAGLKVRTIWATHRDVDIVPRMATKGDALHWLCGRLRIPLPSVLVAGDAGNDSSMFSLPGVHGIIVDNAQPDLLAFADGNLTYCSAAALADGIIEGLHHHGVFMHPSLHHEPRGHDHGM